MQANFFDYLPDLEFFGREVIPLMREAGLATHFVSPAHGITRAGGAQGNRVNGGFPVIASSTPAFRPTRPG